MLGSEILRVHDIIENPFIGFRKKMISHRGRSLQSCDDFCFCFRVGRCRGRGRRRVGRAVHEHHTHHRSNCAEYPRNRYDLHWHTRVAPHASCSITSPSTRLTKYGGWIWGGDQSTARSGPHNRLCLPSSASNRSTWSSFPSWPGRC